MPINYEDLLQWKKNSSKDMKENNIKEDDFKVEVNDDIKGENSIKEINQDKNILIKKESILRGKEDYNIDYESENDNRYNFNISRASEKKELKEELGNISSNAIETKEKEPSKEINPEFLNENKGINSEAVSSNIIKDNNQKVEKEEINLNKNPNQDLNNDKKEEKKKEEKEEKEEKKEENKENKDNNQKENNDSNSNNNEQNSSLGEEQLMNQIMNNIENQEKSKRSRHIQIKLENNIVVGFVPKDLITEFQVTKEGEEEIIPFKRDFSIYEKILKREVPPNPIIKKFNKDEIKIKEDYVLMENLEERDIIPELYEDNDEDIKYLEKSLERSIDKSFDKSYEKSFNASINQSYNQSINQSYNQSYNQSITQSYLDNSLTGNRSKLGLSSGRGIIQKLHKAFSESICENINEFEDDIDEKDDDKENNDKSKDVDYESDEEGKENEDSKSKGAFYDDEEREMEDEKDNDENKNEEEEEAYEDKNEEEEIDEDRIEEESNHEDDNKEEKQD